LTISENPLETLKIVIKAAVPMAIAKTLTHAMS
jgi:hypothetical protein